MNFNDSFGEENNIIIKTIEKGDLAENEKLQKDLNINNNEENKTSFSNNNIFSSVPLEMKEDNEYSNSNIIYDNFLSKELLNYHLSNIFNILKSKTIIIKSQIFYFLKKLSNVKINNLLKAEILYLKISSSLLIISKIYNNNRKIKLFHAFYKLKNKNKINDIFKLKFEMMYKKEKDNLINEINIKLKILEKEIKDIENKTKKLNLKEKEIIIEIDNLIKKENQLNNKITILEKSKNYNNINIMKQQSSNISSINNNSKYDSDIISLESTIETNKQLKEGKEEIIKKFIYKMNDLLNEYKDYIDMLYNNDGIMNNLNMGNMEDNSNSNQPSLSHKDKDGSGNTWYTSKISSGIQINK